MAEDPGILFEEYAARFARGERPDPREYLARAGDTQDELARLIERFLSSVTPPEPSEDSVAMVAGWLEGDPPLLELRRRRGLKRGLVVDVLMKLLGLDPRKREKVARYYHELETGLLDPSRVDGSVLAALAEALRVRADDLLPWPAPRPAPGGVYLRAAEPTAAAPAPLAPEITEERDEIDRLFAGGTGELEDTR
jgi:hypothetical protein